MSVRILAAAPVSEDSVGAYVDLKRRPPSQGALFHSSGSSITPQPRRGAGAIAAESETSCRGVRLTAGGLTPGSTALDEGQHVLYLLEPTPSRAVLHNRTSSSAES